MVVGNKTFRSMIYTNDLIFVASKEEERKGMISRSEKYPDKRKRLLKVVLSKGGERRRKTVWL